MKLYWLCFSSQASGKESRYSRASPILGMDKIIVIEISGRVGREKIEDIRNLLNKRRIYPRSHTMSRLSFL